MTGIVIHLWKIRRHVWYHFL